MRKRASVKSTMEKERRPLGKEEVKIKQKM